MPRISYVNGQYLPHNRAAVHMEDRGLQFADGIYEVVELLGGVLLDEPAHMQRLTRSREAVSIAAPMSDAALRLVIRQLIRRNQVDKGLLYIQVNRGVAPRDHAFPPADTPSSLMMTIMPAKTPSLKQYSEGMSAVTYADNRWSRCDIKSVSLLANVLAKQKAAQVGAREAVLLADDGTVREGSASNLFMVDKDGVLWTHPATDEILHGVVRANVLRFAHAAGMTVKEEAFTHEQLQGASEAFITSSSAHIMPIVQIDDDVMGKGSNYEGQPGPITRQLLHAYHQSILEQTGILCPTPPL